MATTPLTDRQKQVKALLDQGKTPREVGDILGISENAVYQQRARIRKAKGGRKPRRTTGRKSSASRRSGSRTPAASAPRPSPPLPTPAPEVRTLTPLQAIRHRKDEIERAVKGAQADVTAVQKTLAQATSHLEKVQKSHSDEMAKLEAAEAALSNAKPKRGKPKRRRASSSSNGSRGKAAGKAAAAAATPTPPAATPEPAPTQEEPVPAQEPSQATEAAAPTSEAPVKDPAAVGASEGAEFAQEDGFGENG